MLRYASALFISDLHLDAAIVGAEAQASAANLAAFVRLCETDARRHAALFVLGDLFEAYVGDDDLALYPAVVSALRELTATGCALHFIQGNRDFLVGPGFAQATGASLLQAWRSTARNPVWQAGFLAKPLAERHAIAQGLRMQSEAAKQGKSMDIMDVNDQAVLASAEALGIDLLIHGHTHRPARHEMPRAGKPVLVRHVLSDWHVDAQPPRGNALLVDADGIRSIELAAA